MMGIFLYSCPTYFGVQGLLLSLQLTNSTRLAVHPSPRSTCLFAPVLDLRTGAVEPSFYCGLGIKAEVLVAYEVGTLLAGPQAPSRNI